MKPTRTLTVIAVTLTSLLPALVLAQPDSRRDDHRPPMLGRDRPEPSWRDGPPPRGDMRGMHDQRDRRDQQEARDDHGAGPEHAFRRGGRLPADYRSRQYVVDDWRSHRLSAPPRGYHWVQTGADYVLVAVATGIIAQVLLGN